MKIYYGNGQCSFDGKNAIFISINAKYPVEIYDKTPDAFTLMAAKNRITLGLGQIVANKDLIPSIGELFEYIGNLYILNGICVDINSQKHNLKIIRV